ncbi:MAG: SH3 domain-containing protein [Coriobacteriia bacterium]
MGYDERSSGGNLLLRAIGVIVPWTALVVVVVVVIATIAEYRSDRRSWERDATATVEATGTPGGTPSGQAFVRVLSDGLNLRSAPSTSAAILAALAVDQQLVLIEERAGWYHVRTNEGAEGWVAAGGRYTELVQP